MTEMFRNVVRGFSLVHDPEGLHYKRGVPSMTPYCHCEPAKWARQSQKRAVSDQRSAVR